VPISIRTLQDAGKSFTVRVTGSASGELIPVAVIDLSDRETLKGLRFDRATWLIQEKMGLSLWWSESKEPSELLLVMESRNSVSYSPGLNPPEGWGKKIYLRSFGISRVPELPALFCFTLDFDKQ
jgi:hypothetical protein